MKQHDIDSRVREELKGLEANPPVEAWLAISDAIDKHNQSKPLFTASKIAAAALVIIISTISIWMFVSNEFRLETPYTEQVLPEYMEPLNVSSLPQAPLPGQLTITRKVNTSNIPGFYIESQALSSLIPLPVFENEPLPVRRTPSTIIDESSPAIPTQHSATTRQIAAQSSETLIERLLSQNTFTDAGISLGAHFTPRSSYRMLQQYGNPNMQSIPFQALEEQIITYGMGLSLNYKLSGKWSLESGIGMISIGQYVKDIFSYNHPVNMPLFESSTKTGQAVHPQSVITSQGNIIFSDLYHYYSDILSSRIMTNRQSVEDHGLKTLRKSNEGLTQVFSYVELPVTISYELFRSNFAVRFKAGVAGHYLLQNDVYLGSDITQNPVGETYGVSKFNFSAIGGLSLSLPLTNKISFNLDPTVQIFLMPVAGKGLIYGEAYPYSFMLQTGVSYGF